MIDNRFLALALIAVLVAGALGYKHMTAPTNTYECMLQNIQGATATDGAKILVKACTSLFPPTEEPDPLELMPREPLKWEAGGWEWRWHQTDPPIQVANNLGTTYFRRVYPEQNYQVLASVQPPSEDNDSLGLSATVTFHVDCTIGTEIETNATYSDGTPKRLSCARYGELQLGVAWSQSLEPSFELDTPGFSFVEWFSEWDLKPGIREAVIKTAKAPETDS